MVFAHAIGMVSRMAAMTSVLATFATHWLRPAAAPRGFGLGARKPSLGAAILSVLGHGYRVAQRAQMRRIRMELALHGHSRRSRETTAKPSQGL